MNGKIKSCPKNGCNFHCCDFNQNNFIVLFPNELDNIKNSGKSYSHLKVTENLGENSHKVICNAVNRKNCDNGYKPVDCRLYPLFPTKNENYYIKGTKCPLSSSDLNNHIENCKSIISNLKFCEAEELKNWYEQIDLVGYEKYNRE